jgi:hypothetical protein
MARSPRQPDQCRPKGWRREPRNLPAPLSQGASDANGAHSVVVGRRPNLLTGCLPRARHVLVIPLGYQVGALSEKSKSWCQRQPSPTRRILWAPSRQFLVPNSSSTPVRTYDVRLAIRHNAARHRPHARCFRLSRGSNPRLLRLPMNGLLDRTCGERPHASRFVRVARLDLPDV